MSDEPERCTLCLGVKLSPITLRCGHSFCRACLKRYKTYNKFAYSVRCPLCRNRITRRTIVRTMTRFPRPQFRRIVTRAGNIARIRSTTLLTQTSDVRSTASTVAAINDGNETQPGTSQSSSNNTVNSNLIPALTTTQLTSEEGNSEQVTSTANMEMRVVGIPLLPQQHEAESTQELIDPAGDQEQQYEHELDGEVESEYEKLSMDESDDDSVDDNNGTANHVSIDYDEASMRTVTTIMSIDTNRSPDDYFFYYDASDYDFNMFDLAVRSVNTDANNNNNETNNQNNNEGNANANSEQVTLDQLPPNEVVGNEFSITTTIEQNNENDNGGEQVEEGGSLDSSHIVHTNSITITAGSVQQVDIVNFDGPKGGSNDLTSNVTTSAGEVAQQYEIVNADESAAGGTDNYCVHLFE